MIDSSPDTVLRGHRARWVLHPQLPGEIRAGIGDTSVMLAHLLYCRGHHSADAILEFYKGRQVSHDPFAIPGMSEAVERIVLARERGESVAVFGDFDCDGITATEVLTETLEALGFDPLVHIPERVDGHGLQPESLAALRDLGVTLVVTADCGITAIDEVQVALGLGLDVIVTDHHEPHPDGSLPDCPVVAPTRLHSEYPFRGLCGAGVAYKLAKALAARLPETVDPSRSLDLVAMGTVADVVPLVDENRSLVIAGLQRLRETQRPGLLALFAAAGVDRTRLDPMSIGFYLAPRINAANRLASPRAAYDLLTAPDAETAAALADNLSELNRQRQTIVETVMSVLLSDLGDPTAMAEDVAAGRKPPVLVVQGEWPSGISGLLAARLVERYGLPAFVGTREGEIIVVSARGTPGSRVDELLERCEASLPGGLFVGYGGHSRAGGFRVIAERWPLTQQLLQAHAATGDRDEAGAVLHVDAEVRLAQLSLEAAKAVRSLAPFGMDFPEPLFLARNVVLKARRATNGDRHQKVRLAQRGGSIGGIFFNAPAAFVSIPLETRLDVLFHLELNEWNGAFSVEARIRDWRLAD